MSCPMVISETLYGFTVFLHLGIFVLLLLFLKSGQVILATAYGQGPTQSLLFHGLIISALTDSCVF